MIRLFLIICFVPAWPCLAETEMISYQEAQRIPSVWLILQSLSSTLSTSTKWSQSVQSLVSQLSRCPPSWLTLSPDVILYNDATISPCTARTLIIILPTLDISTLQTVLESHLRGGIRKQEVAANIPFITYLLYCPGHNRHIPDTDQHLIIGHWKEYSLGLCILM